jgi:hypothetical protein
VTAAQSTQFAVMVFNHSPIGLLLHFEIECQDHSASQSASKQLRLSVLAILLSDFLKKN